MSQTIGVLTQHLSVSAEDAECRQRVYDALSQAFPAVYRPDCFRDLYLTPPGHNYPRVAATLRRTTHCLLGYIAKEGTSYPLCYNPSRGTRGCPRTSSSCDLRAHSAVATAQRKSAEVTFSPSSSGPQQDESGSRCCCRVCEWAPVSDTRHSTRAGAALLSAWHSSCGPSCTMSLAA